MTLARTSLSATFWLGATTGDFTLSGRQPNFDTRRK
jgi:hypothetical protein